MHYVSVHCYKDRYSESLTQIYGEKKCMRMGIRPQQLFDENTLLEKNMAATQMGVLLMTSIVFGLAKKVGGNDRIPPYLCMGMHITSPLEDILLFFCVPAKDTNV
jgi:hypothetical protein